MAKSGCLHRRDVVAGGASLMALFSTGVSSRADEPKDHFVAEAVRQRDLAVSAGDQPYGAVIVRGGHIVGYGRSRVVSERNTDAHAERVALRDAQLRLGRADLSGAVIYATSRPCMVCQPVLASAGITAMYVGVNGTDAGPPSGGPG